MWRPRFPVSSVALGYQHETCGHRRASTRYERTSRRAPRPAPAPGSPGRPPDGGPARPKGTEARPADRRAAAPTTRAARPRSRSCAAAGRRAGRGGGGQPLLRPLRAGGASTSPSRRPCWPRPSWPSTPSARWSTVWATAWVRRPRPCGRRWPRSGWPTSRSRRPGASPSPEKPTARRHSPGTRRRRPGERRLEAGRFVRRCIEDPRGNGSLQVEARRSQGTSGACRHAVPPEKIGVLIVVVARPVHGGSPSA